MTSLTRSWIKTREPHRLAIQFSLAAALLALVAFGGAVVAAGAGVVRLATTTSTENSGLLGHLLPPFESRTGLTVHVLAVGTGKALRIAERGDVDLVMVHAKPAEERFVAAGYGLARHEVMYNDFVIVGPAQDPARLRAAADTADALRRIAQTASRFVSRGDDSGTHKRESRLWASSGIEPHGEWYMVSGQGMGRVLLMADELDAYTLTDRGTWLFMRDKSRLSLLFENDPPLHNQYSVIAVNPERHPHTNHVGGKTFIEWLLSAEGQSLIDSYRVAGEQPFYPMHDPGS